MIVDYESKAVKRFLVQYRETTRKIYPTIFSDKYTLGKKSINIQGNSGEVIFTIYQNSIENPDYFTKHTRGNRIFVQDLSHKALLLIYYIADTIDSDTNVYNANNKDLCAYLKVSERTLKDLFTELSHYNWLAKTDIDNKYVINHTRIFSGRMEKFKSKYIALYGNEIARIDGFGRIKVKDMIRKSDKDKRKEEKSNK